MTFLPHTEAPASCASVPVCAHGPLKAAQTGQTSQPAVFLEPSAVVPTCASVPPPAQVVEILPGRVAHQSTEAGCTAVYPAILPVDFPPPAIGTPAAVGRDFWENKLNDAEYADLLRCREIDGRRT